ncbi:hypothetical protein MTR_3g048593 [Medicago truncatula]|uniref:Disease resistance protein At4g27190-like leucine-rich repeats domain-containing protein n=1 Tax=Medicago truncatula TaxID=3880 RepID=A0A072UW97_MEDTR|nr:hypothetical protein MTR_3g048593 [Medicago truncatula]
MEWECGAFCRFGKVAVSERKMNLGLQNIELRTLPTMTCLFKGLKKSFSLKNLTMMIIVGCEKLEIIFSISIIMCLPQLHHIRIEDCKELKHIIEDDLENKKSSNFMVAKTVCFPKLKTLVVVTCHKLKNVFPISIYKELPELKVIIIVEAEKLEEIFVCEVDQEVNIPNLRYVAFLNLPSLSQTQRIHFQAVQNRSILRCQELSLTSAMREYDVLGSLIWEFLPDYEWFWGPAHGILRNLTLYQTGLASEHVLTSSQLASSPSENEPHGIEITAEEGTTLKSSSHLKPASSSSDLLATSKHITTSQIARASTMS